MGKIGNIRLTHKNSGKSTLVKVNFYVKDKMFRVVDMPQEIKAWYGSKLTREQKHGSRLYSGTVQASSYEVLEDLAKSLYDEYYDQDIRESKVIAYKIKTNLPGNKKDIFHAPNLALGMDFQVLYKFLIGEEEFYSTGNYEQSRQPKMGMRMGGHKMVRKDSHVGYGDYTIIPHTEELHQFFKNTSAGLENLILKINDFFGEDESHLLENIKTKGIKYIK